MTEAKVLIWHSLSHLTLLTVRLDRVPVKVLLYKSTNFYVSQLKRVHLSAEKL